MLMILPIGHRPGQAPGAGTPATPIRVSLSKAAAGSHVVFSKRRSPALAGGRSPSNPPPRAHPSPRRRSAIRSSPAQRHGAPLRKPRCPPPRGDGPAISSVCRRGRHAHSKHSARLGNQGVLRRLRTWIAVRPRAVPVPTLLSSAPHLADLATRPSEARTCIGLPTKAMTAGPRWTTQRRRVSRSVKTTTHLKYTATEDNHVI